MAILFCGYNLTIGGQEVKASGNLPPELSPLSSYALSDLYVTSPAPDTDAQTPDLISAVKFTSISNFELGGTAVDASGYVWTWGYNGAGRTGVGKTSGYLGGMTRIPFFVDSNITIDYVVSGYQTTFAISTNGELYAWGSNSAGGLGIGNTTDQSTPQKVNLPLLSGEKVILVDPSENAGGNNTTVYAVTNTGRVFAWGYGTGNMIPGYNGTNSTPFEVTSLTTLGNTNEGIKKISVGNSQVLILTNNGKVFSFGSNNYGSLGIGNSTSTSTVTEIPGLINVDIVDIDADYHHSMALSSDGSVYQWGQVYGYTAAAASTVNTPTIVKYDYSSASYTPVAKKIAAGMYSGYIIDQHGRLWIWGRNVYYQFMQDGPLYGTTGTTTLYDYTDPLKGKLDTYLSLATQVPKSLGDGDTQYNHTVPKAPVFSGYTYSSRFAMTLNGYESAGVWSDIDDNASKKHPTIYDKKYYQTTGTMGTISEGAGLAAQRAAHKDVYLIDNQGRRLVYVVRQESGSSPTTLSGNYYVAEDTYNGGWFVNNRTTTSLPSGVTEITSVPVAKDDEKDWIELATGGKPNDFTGTQGTEVPYAAQIDPYESSMTLLDLSGNIYKQTYNGSGNVAWGWDYNPAYDSSSNNNPSVNGLYDSYVYELMFMRGAPRVSPTTVQLNSPLKKIYKSQSNQQQQTDLKITLGTSTVSEQLNITINPELHEAKYILIPFDSAGTDSNASITEPTAEEFDAAYTNAATLGYEVGDLIDLNGWTTDELINTSDTSTKTLEDNGYLVVKDNCILWVMTRTTGYNANVSSITRMVYDNYYTDTTVYHDGVNIDPPNEQIYDATNQYVAKTADSKDSDDEDMTIYGVPLDKDGNVIQTPTFGYDKVSIRAFQTGDPEYRQYIDGWYFLDSNLTPVEYALDSTDYLIENKFVHTFNYERDPAGWVTITYKGRFVGTTTDIDPYVMDGLTGNEGIVNNQETVKKSTVGSSGVTMTLTRTPADVANATPLNFSVDGGTAESLVNGKVVFNTISDRTISNMEVIIYYNRAELFVRQVILNSNADVVVPSQGYFSLVNTDGTTSGKQYNMIVNSGANETVSFKRVQLQTETGKHYYSVNPILPEMYQYYGYRISTTEESHSAATLEKDPEKVKIDFSSGSKYYVTLYLEPSLSSSNDIPFYNWDYHLNNFGEITN